MSAREDIASAANAGTGLNVTPYYRQTTKPGDGWVSLISFDQDDTRLGFMERWQVVVVLPGDVRSAEEWIDSNVDDLLAAVAPELIVTYVAPMPVAVNTGSVSGLVIEGSRPH